MPKSLPIAGRWLEKLDVTEGCWEWTGSRDKDGYGKFQYPGEDGRQVHTRAHRWAYETFVGPIPEGHVVMHTCDNPPCSRPDHLVTGTPLANNDDKVRKGRHAKTWGNSLNRARQTHCKNNHPLSGRNLWINPKTGHRRCRQCAADRARATAQRKRATA